MRTSLRRLLLAGLATLASALPAWAEPAMWRVSDTDSEIWLFGSIHMFSRDIDWRTPEFDSALEEAEHVWFEMVFDAEAYATIASLTLLEGRLPDGGKLADLLTPEQNRRLDEAIAASGLDPLVFEHLQPWMAEVTLSTAGIGGTSAGVDILVDAEVEPARKRGFETAEQQLGFFKDVPLDEQVDNLMSTVAGLGAGGVAEQMAGLTDAWEAGDVAALDRLIKQEMGPSDSVRYRRLVADRNMRWVETIEDLLASNDESMIIVGAGHLVGPDGVPTLLAQRGFEVERIGEESAAAPETARQPARRR